MTTFGLDVLVGRKHIPPVELRQALSGLVGVPTNRVSVITDVADYPERERADVVCTVSAVDGEFPTLLSVDGLALAQGEDRLLLLERLSRALDAACLTGTDDANPYAMWHVEEGKPPRRVYLVVDGVDKGRYDIDHQRS